MCHVGLFKVYSLVAFSTLPTLRNHHYVWFQNIVIKQTETPRPQEALAAPAPAVGPLSPGLPALGPSTREACASRLSCQPCLGTEARSRQGRP